MSGLQLVNVLLEAFHIAGQVSSLRSCLVTELSVFPLESKLSGPCYHFAGPV